jgi:hypothetical protein
LVLAVNNNLSELDDVRVVKLSQDMGFFFKDFFKSFRAVSIAGRGKLYSEKFVIESCQFDS